MRREKEKEEDWPALKIAWMYQYEDSRTTIKIAKEDLLLRLITVLTT